MKLTTITLITLMFTNAACIDLIKDSDQEHTPSPQWELDEQPTQPIAPNAPIMPITPPTSPVASDCEHPSAAPQHSADAASAQAQPTLIERLDARGCVEDRHTARYDARGLATERTYAFFNPELAFQTYMTLINYRELMSYDARGLLVEHTRMHLETDEVYYHERRAYDAQGRLLKLTREGGDADHLIHNNNSVETLIYHGSGELERMERYYGGELVDKEEFVRTPSGLPLERYALVTSREGSALKLMTRWRYDERARHATVEALPHGTSHHTLTQHSYRDDDTLESTRVENYTQGWLERSRYDGLGEELYYEQDENGDGVPEFIRERLVDLEQRSVTRRTRYNHDGQGNYKTINTITEHFDEQGRLTQRREVASGHRDHVHEHTRRWDASGATTEDRSSFEGAPLILITRARYDLQERLLWRQSFDRDHQQTPRSSEQLRYNLAGQLLERTQQSPEHTTTQTVSYDPAGHKLRELTTQRTPEQATQHIEETLWRYHAPQP